MPYKGRKLLIVRHFFIFSNTKIVTKIIRKSNNDKKEEKKVRTAVCDCVATVNDKRSKYSIIFIRP